MVKLRMKNASPKVIVSALIYLLLLESCATYKEIYTSEGEKGYSINCSGTALNWGMCYEKAGKLCGKRGYYVLNRYGDTGALMTGNQFGLYAGSVINRVLIIKCK